MTGGEFDRRVRMVVEFHGDATDRELLDESLAERRWPVVRDLAPEERTHFAQATAPGTFLLVEARLKGARRGAERAAALELTAWRSLRALDVRVHHAQAYTVGEDNRPLWAVHRAPARQGLRDRLAVLAGIRDTGPVVGAATRDRAREAARAVPAPEGSGSTAAPMDVRLGWAAAEPTTVPPTPGAAPGAAPLVITTLVALFAGVALSAVGPMSVYGALAAVTACGTAALSGWLLHRVAHPERQRGARVTGSVASAASTLTGWLVSTVSGDHTRVWWVSLLLAIAAFLAGGIRALVRQWTSLREALQWVVPLVASAVLTLTPALGGVVHWLYLAPFGLTPDDVDVPAVWRVIAALSFLPVLPAWLLVAAGWGYAKHFHQVVTHRWIPVTAIALTGVFCTLLPLLQVSLHAARAGEHAWHRAAGHQAPGSYYGIEPQLTCIEPLKPRIAAEGGVLVPRRPYLLLGSAGGTLALWDVHRRQPLKVPSGEVTSVPVGDHTSRCSEAGRATG
ncbi:hypothetical protein ABZ851_11155 [Streptomyces sp. NPDC047049]|uniref:hypothetical protein n=1 Tax=Streptomyces sp. NPDC047049 TaxID=3156688 RepID=UPI0033FA85F7